MDDEKLELEELLHYIGIKLKFINTKFPNINVDESNIIGVLMSSYMDKFKSKLSLEFYDNPISKIDIDLALDLYDFNQIKNEVLLEFEIPPELEELETKVKIKTNGKVFIIHKNDIDPFPSNPHAHWLDSNLKVDLSNGKCYQVKKHLFTLKKKDFFELRLKANKLGVVLPNLE